MVTGNVIEKGPLAVNHAMIHFGGEGTYPSSSLFVSGNTFINDSASGAIGVLNQTVDPGSGASVPATIAGNTFYGVDAPNLFQDDNKPPFDIASNNVFFQGPGPALDTSPGFDVPEPASGAALMFAVLGVALVRYARRRVMVNQRAHP